MSTNTIPKRNSRPWFVAQLCKEFGKLFRPQSYNHFVCTFMATHIIQDVWKVWKHPFAICNIYFMHFKIFNTHNTLTLIYNLITYTTCSICAKYTMKSISSSGWQTKLIRLVTVFYAHGLIFSSHFHKNGK